MNIDDDLNLVNNSALRRYLKEYGMQVSGNFDEAISNRIKLMLIDATTRATANHRKTLMSWDI